jgi:hypothetical protein
VEYKRFNANPRREIRTGKAGNNMSVIHKITEMEDRKRTSKI